MTKNKKEALSTTDVPPLLAVISLIVTVLFVLCTTQPALMKLQGNIDDC